MGTKLFDKFIATIEHETGQTYLALNVIYPQKEQIHEYQVEMLANNPKPSILPFEIRRKDEEIKLYYNITSKVPLEDFLKSRRLSKTEFLDLLMGMNENILGSKNLFLKEKNFVISEQFIYVDPKRLTFCMVYLPTEIQLDYYQALREFILQLITRIAVLEIREGDNYLQKIIEFVKAPEFSLAGFNKLLHGMKSENTPIQYGEASKNEVPDVEENKLDSNIKQFEHRVDLLRSEPEGKKAQMGEGSTRKIFGYDVRIVLVVLLSQILVIGLALGMDAILKTSGVGSDTRYILIALMVLILDLLFFKYFIVNGKVLQVLPKPKSKTAPLAKTPSKQQGQGQVVQPVNMNKKQISNVEFGKNKTLGDAKGSNTHGVQAADTKKEPVGEGHSEGLEETVVLDESMEKPAFLVRNQEGMIEKIQIGCPRFVIGRNPQASDMVMNEKAVGRVHAEIVVKENHFYLIDKQSKNGTFINGKRLQSGQEYKLANNDTILFANIKFTFIKE